MDPVDIRPFTIWTVDRHPRAWHLRNHPSRDRAPEPIKLAVAEKMGARDSPCEMDMHVGVISQVSIDAMGYQMKRDPRGTEIASEFRVGAIHSSRGRLRYFRSTFRWYVRP